MPKMSKILKKHKANHLFSGFINHFLREITKLCQNGSCGDSVDVMIRTDKMAENEEKVKKYLHMSEKNSNFATDLSNMLIII